IRLSEFEGTLRKFRFKVACLPDSTNLISTEANMTRASLTRGELSAVSPGSLGPVVATISRLAQTAAEKGPTMTTEPQRDLEQQHRSEELGQRHAQILNHVHDAVISTDLDGVIQS